MIASVLAWEHIHACACFATCPSTLPSLPNRIAHSVLLLVDAQVFGESIKLNPQVFALVKGYGTRFVEWINSEDRGVLSDITQGEEMTTLLQGFIETSLFVQRSKGPLLKRMKNARTLSSLGSSAKT